MNKNFIVAVLLAVLVFVSVVQAFQLNELKGKVSSGTIGKTHRSDKKGNKSARDKKTKCRRV